jgi:hypothetical protein
VRPKPYFIITNNHSNTKGYMDKKNDGGPAFPTLAVLGDRALSEGGLTVRDYFAAKALPGLIGRVWNADGKLSGDEVIALWAQSAYAMADAMIAEREKGATS